MKKFASRLPVLLLAGAMTVASGAYAGGLYDGDDSGYDADHRQGFSRYCQENRDSDVCDSYYNGNSQRYGNGSNHRQGSSRYCRENPDSDVCETYQNGNSQRYGNGYAYQGVQCAAIVRAVGKRNIFTGFARNSARFAWIREARFIHGDQYANWHLARDLEISCTLIGGLKSCVAIGTPCRY